MGSEPHEVTLNQGRLMLDHYEGNFRVAFYFKPSSKNVEGRYATSQPSLRDALQNCFRAYGNPYEGVNVYDKSKEIEDYIRSTQWGSQLP